MQVSDLTNEELLGELVYTVESVSMLCESNYYIELRNEVLSRMSNGVANNVINPTAPQ